MHAITQRRLLQARQWRQTPPSFDFLSRLPAGYVTEVMAAWQADLQREAHQMAHAAGTPAS